MREPTEQAVTGPPLDPRAWAQGELGDADLGDARRTARLVRVAADWAAQPTASFPQLAGDHAAIKALYYFFGLAEQLSDRDFPEAIRAAHHRATARRLAGQPYVLAVQDTTQLDFTAHPATDDLGPVGNGKQQGLLLHSTLAVQLDGQPLGLLAQRVWTRDGAEPATRAERRDDPITEKESSKWLAALPASQADLPADVTLIHVGDREADSYDLFLAVAATPRTELLIRATGTRGVDGPDASVRAAVLAQPVVDTQVRTLPRADDRPARQAELTLRYTRVTLTPPRHRAGEHLPPVTLDAVLVQERDAPAGVAPIEWLLLTTVPVDSVAAAWERVDWYTYRWRVERYHFVLKSGLQVEARQLRTAARLDCCVAVACVIACYLLLLTYLARTQPDLPALGLLHPGEWVVLWAARHPGRPVPAAPTLRQAVREIAGLGGFLGRRGDGEPGLKTLWRGLIRLQDLLCGYHLARLVPGDVGNA